MARALQDIPLAPRHNVVRPSALLTMPGMAATAAVALGLAVSVNYGQFHPQAVAWLAAAVLATAVAVARARTLHGNLKPDETNPPPPPRAATAVWAGLLGLQFVLLVARHPTVPQLAGDTGLPLFRIAVAVIAAGAVAGLFAAPRLKVLCVAAMLGGYLAAGAILLATHPVPGVDVVTFQRDACDALLAGRSPYAITFPDESPAGTSLYAPGVARDGRLHFGFPYPPLSLLVVLPFHAVGDFRYAGLVATAAAAGLIAFASPRPPALAAAGLLLLTPMGFFVAWAGWTEPLVLLCLAGTVFCAGRVRHTAVPQARSLDANSPRPKAVPHIGPGSAPSVDPTFVTSTLMLAVPLGLLLASKQYAVLLLPLVPLLVPAGRRLRTVLAGLAVAAAITLPMALWDSAAFLHSAVLLQFRQPFRADALSFLAPLHGVLPHAAAAALPFALTLAATACVLKACPRTPAGFALGSAAVLLVFFALNKQAFCNYYHLVIGALCCAIATQGNQPQMNTDAHR